ncbi:hypothetical protein AOLI_G00234720 [Acnodon oligacanthus]
MLILFVPATATVSDPCNNYTALDQPWRATNAAALQICDHYFIWNGWYRMLYNGMSVRMPESCVAMCTCGTDITLWLNGLHPQTQDGIVTRGVCATYAGSCCYQSVSIRVKACPDNYTVYEFVRPNICNAAYCADVNTITPTNTLATVTSSAATAINISSDPCNISRVLDDTWRSVSMGYSGNDDTVAEWSGWYRLYLQGRSAQMPEWVFYSGYVRCGGYSSLLLGGPHPLLKDGIVTRDVYGWNPQYSSYRSNPIQVRACPGSYYVYRLVRPAVSIPMPTYCAGIVTHILNPVLEN